jgi:hypothetical protein
MKQNVFNGMMALSFFAASACLAGTPSLPETQITSVNLSKYKTFGWDPSQKNLMTENPRSISAVSKRAVIAQMQARGYILDMNSPQLIVKLEAKVQSPADAQLVTPQQVGTDAPVIVISDLVLSMTDAKTNELVWSNSADIRISNAQEKIPAKSFQDAVNELYASYPVLHSRSKYGEGYVSLPPPPAQNNDIKWWYDGRTR